MAEQVVVEIDQDLCLSSGRCVSDIPEAFAFDDDDLAQVSPDARSVEIGRLREVARNCPGQAITVSVKGE